MIGERAEHEIQLAAGVVVAELLGVLVLLRGVLRQRGDRQPGEIAVVGRLPVPEPPRGDRGQRAGADVPLHPQPDAADDVARAEIGIDVGQAVKRVSAGGSIALCCGERGELAVERALGRAGADENGGAAFRVLAAVVARQQDVEIAARFPQQLPAKADVVLFVDVIPAGDVEQCALTAGPRQREPRRHGIAERAGDRRLDLLEPEVAGRSLRPAFEIEGRLAAGDVDRARGGVLTIERALRPAQHLDLGDVEEVESRGGDPRIIDVVDEYPHALIEPVVGKPKRRADPADRQRGVARVGRIVLQRRGQLLKATHVEAAGVVDVLAAHHRDSQRHLLRSFVAAARGDDDLVAVIARAGADRRGLRDCRVGWIFGRCRRDGRILGKGVEREQRNGGEQTGTNERRHVSKSLCRELATSGGPVCGDWRETKGRGRRMRAPAPGNIDKGQSS